MIPALEPWLEKLEAMSVREHLLIGVTVFFLVGSVLQILLADPLVASHGKAANIVTSARNQGINLQARLNSGESGPRQQQRDQLLRQLGDEQLVLAQIDKELANYASTLIPPRDMPGLLQQVLHQGDVKLVSIQNQKPVAVIQELELAAEQSPDADQLQLYRHGLTIVLRGDYHALRKYLESLEQQEWKFLWQSMSFSVVKHPVAELEIKLQTLSTDERWLGV